MLQIGAVTETVEVTEQVPLLNSENGAHGSVISEEMVSALPLNGRQFIQLTLLVPGANPGGSSSTANCRAA